MYLCVKQKSLFEILSDKGEKRLRSFVFHIVTRGPCSNPTQFRCELDISKLLLVQSAVPVPTPVQRLEGKEQIVRNKRTIVRAKENKRILFATNDFLWPFTQSHVFET